MIMVNEGGGIPFPVMVQVRRTRAKRSVGSSAKARLLLLLLLLRQLEHLLHGLELLHAPLRELRLLLLLLLLLLLYLEQLECLLRLDVEGLRRCTQARAGAGVVSVHHHVKMEGPRTCRLRVHTGPHSLAARERRARAPRRRWAARPPAPPAA